MAGKTPQTAKDIDLPDGVLHLLTSNHGSRDSPLSGDDRIYRIVA
jgi:hypothetical protein